MDEDKKQIEIPLVRHAERIARAADKQIDRDFADRQERARREQNLRDRLDRGRPGRNQQSFNP